MKEIGRGGGDRIYQLIGNTGVVRRNMALYGIERNGLEFLVPPECPQKMKTKFLSIDDVNRINCDIRGRLICNRSLPCMELKRET